MGAHMRVEGWLTNLDAAVPDVQRLVAIAPSSTEILHSLGVGRRIVAVDDWSDFPPRVLQLPRVGSDLSIDIERVRACRPDLVVASLHVPGMEANIPRLQAAGLAYLAVGGVGLQGVWEDMRVIGRYLGREARAAALVGDAQDRMARVRDRYEHVTPKPRVHWEWSGGGRPFVAARRSWVTEMIEMAGGHNAYADVDAETVRVTTEEAVARGPDVVVACWCGARKPPTAARVAARLGWQDTPAVRQGRIVVFPEDLFGRPGPRLAVGQERLARLLHPEIDGCQ